VLRESPVIAPNDVVLGTGLSRVQRLLPDAAPNQTCRSGKELVVKRQVWLDRYGNRPTAVRIGIDNRGRIHTREDSRRIRQIAQMCVVVGERDDARFTERLTETLIIHKKEHLVPLNRSAKRAAELPPAKGSRTRLVEEVAGIESAVAQESVNGPV